MHEVLLHGAVFAGNFSAMIEDWFTRSLSQLRLDLSEKCFAQHKSWFRCNVHCSRFQSSAFHAYSMYIYTSNLHIAFITKKSPPFGRHSSSDINPQTAISSGCCVLQQPLHTLIEIVSPLLANLQLGEIVCEAVRHARISMVVGIISISSNYDGIKSLIY